MLVYFICLLPFYLKRGLPILKKCYMCYIADFPSILRLTYHSGSVIVTLFVYLSITLVLWTLPTVQSMCRANMVIWPFLGLAPSELKLCFKQFKGKLLLYEGIV